MFLIADSPDPEPRARTGVYGAAAGGPPLAPLGWWVRCKVVLEYLAALLLLVPGIPLILFSALLVKLTSRGPAFYSQIRVGQDGKPYRIWKIRTMTHDAEAQSGACWSMPGDRRVTPVGRFLRRTHLDEWPQLWNVLRGEMGLIGPRPERPEFVPQLERAIPHYRERLRIRPGITGLAQIQVPADTDLDSVRRKLAYDLYYIRHASPVLDFKILLCTACRIAGVPFYISGRLFHVPGQNTVEGQVVTTPVLREPAPSRV